MNDPIAKFKSWWQEAKEDSPLEQKSAVCVSTVDAEGQPDGRFVDLKDVSAQGFTFCTYLDSKKAEDIQCNPNVALTFWWEHVGYQVRVSGKASQIPGDLADNYWQSRSREAQLTTLSSQQSQVLDAPHQLIEEFEKLERQMSDIAVSRPDNWGGFNVTPHRIEFLTFMQSRLHIRELFTLEGGEWKSKLLQP